MDSAEAKLLLQACRAHGQDAALPVFAEALALAERDPEMKAWWEAQQSFDRKISTKLKEVAPPADLRGTILAGRKIEQLTPRFRLPYWLAAAAVVVFCLGIGLHYGERPSPAAAPRLASNDYDASVLQYLGRGPELALVENDHAKVNAWLEQRHAPTGSFPVGMAALPTLGCQQLTLRGHAVSFICFSLAGGEVAHLFIIEKQGLSDPPGPSPVYNQSGNWSTAAWSDTSKSYLLVTQAGPEALKQLL